LSELYGYFQNIIWLLFALKCQIEEDKQMHVSESGCVFLIFFNLLKVTSQIYVDTKSDIIILAQGQGSNGYDSSIF
jgi:hypothetical protein